MDLSELPDVLELERQNDLFCEKVLSNTITIDSEETLKANDKSYDWIRPIRQYLTTYDITDHHTYIEDPAGLHNTTLLPHQKYVIKAIQDLESQKMLIASFSRIRCKEIESPLLYCETTAAVLADKVGSGKTFIILGLILSKQRPRVTYSIVPHDRRRMHSAYNRMGDHITKYVKECYKFNEIRVNDIKNGKWALNKILINKLKNIYPTLTKNNSILYKTHHTIRANLIFTASSVIHTWRDTITRFTDLNVFVITDVRHLRVLYNSILDDSVNNYDIVLVKYGKITGKFEFKRDMDNLCSDPNNLNTIDIISDISRGYMWERLIIDDFDTIKLPSVFGNISANFTLFISTTEYVSKYNATNIPLINSYGELLNKQRQANNSIITNNELLSIFKIKCSDSLINKSINMGIPLFWKYTFNHSDSKLLNLFWNVTDDRVKLIVNMINADAIGEAASVAGIKTTSIAEIFQTVLNNQYEEWKNAFIKRNFIDKQLEAIHTLPTNVSNQIDDSDITKKYRYTVEQLNKLIPVKYYSAEIEQLLNTKRDEYALIEEANGKAIERVKDNIKEGNCVICYSELREHNIFWILKCCGITLCKDCGKINTVGKTANENINKCPKCPNCRKDYNFTDLIYIGKDTTNSHEFDKIVQLDTPSIIESITAEPPTVEVEISNVTPLRCKIDAIMDIIHGIKPVEQCAIPIQSKLLLIGNKVLPDALYKKLVVFADYDESFTKLKQRLTLHNISFITLGGTAKQLHTIVEQFRTTDTKVLLINSSKHCAGINLQFCTDLVIMHSILNRNVEAQILGRIQRLNVTHQVNIHYMLYEDDAKNLCVK